jgi:hypothetical protein
MVVFLPRPATADSVADLKTRAIEVSQKLIQDQLQIGAYQQQYSLATVKVAADGRNIARIGQQISRDEQRVKRETDDLRQQAIESYMQADSDLSTADGMIFSGNVQRVSLASEYGAIAAGNTDTSIDLLRTAQRNLHTQQTTLQQQQSQDQSDQKAEAIDLDQAVTTEHQMASVQSEVTGQLAAAVTAQAAAQAASAAAAVAAAQRAAAQKAAQNAPTKTATGSDPSVPVSGSVSDPTLNSFLQCVVQVESGGDYSDVSPNGLYMGAFQFSQETWNIAAQAAGLPQLVGVPPNLASKADQDSVAVALYALDGRQPWLGDRCS